MWKSMPSSTRANRRLADRLMWSKCVSILNVALIFVFACPSTRGRVILLPRAAKGCKNALITYFSCGSLTRVLAFHDFVYLVLEFCFVKIVQRLRIRFAYYGFVYKVYCSDILIGDLVWRGDLWSPLQINCRLAIYAVQGGSRARQAAPLHLGDKKEKNLMKIIIVTGPSGVGKSTVCKKLAENSPHEKAVHFHTDDFYHYIAKGYIAPCLPESNAQNKTIIRAIAAAAAELAKEGYEVYVDGVIGWWFIDEWQNLVKIGTDVRYIVLQADESVNLNRNENREKSVDIADLQNLRKGFATEWHTPYHINSSNKTVDETVEIIQKSLNNGEFKLKI